jgi:outer membrane immunogenic protein
MRKILKETILMYKMKISFLFFLLVLLFSGHVAHAKVRESFYVGIGLEDSSNHFDLTTKNSTTSLSVERSKNRNKVQGSVFLGYGYTTPCLLYLAAEVGSYFPHRFTKISRPGVTLAPFTYVDCLSIQDYLTGDLLFGYRPWKFFLLYLRGGVSCAQMQIYQFRNEAANVPVFKAHQIKAGGRIGAGLNFGLTRHVGLGLDYFFTQYQKLEPFWAQYTIQFSEKIHSHLFGISAIYSF